MSTGSARQRMIEVQLRSRGISDKRVLDAMSRVPREQFVSNELKHLAYTDQALPIDCQQTISQPYIVALMSMSLSLEPAHRVLEIGTGSGYQTAVLAELSQRVTTVERHADLSATSQKILHELGYQNIEYEIGDGAEGVARAAPYDRIIITAAAPRVPPAIWEQLKEDGILVAPLGDSHQQQLQRIQKQQGKAKRLNLCGCRFVPFVSPAFD